MLASIGGAGLTLVGVAGDVTTVEFSGISIDMMRQANGAHEAVLLHAAPFQCWYRPLVTRFEAMTDVSVLTYQRRIATEGFGLTADADAVLAALRRAGSEPVHVVGHSWGGILALEMARRAPAAVRSLALLEPAPTAFLDAAETAAAFAPLLDRIQVEGSDAAMRAFLGLVLGDGAEDLLRRHVPDGVEEAARWAEQFFAAEVPALIPWTYGGDDAAAVTAPVLLVSGAASTPRFRRGGEVLAGWFPDADHLELDGVGHLLMAARPERVAAGLRAFWGRVSPTDN
jgi:pimeloyl-ACP methyl ester carboxylesterase